MGESPPSENEEHTPEVASTDCGSPSVARWTEDNPRYYFNDILRELGWAENIAMPLPNSENMQLLHSMLEKRRLMSAMRIEESQVRAELEASEAGLRTVRGEVEETRRMLAAQQASIDGEAHLTQMLRSQIAATQKEERGLQQEMKECQYLLHVWTRMKREAEKKGQNATTDIRATLEELEVYSERLLLVDELRCTVERYYRQDEGAVGSKEREISRLNQRLLLVHGQLQHERDATGVAQLALDREAQTFKRLTEERKQLILHWFREIESAKRRDKQLLALRTNLGHLQVQTAEMDEKVGEYRQFSAHLVDNNSETERSVAQLDREKAALVEQMRQLDQQREEMTRQVNTIKLDVSHHANLLNNAREEVQELAMRVDQMEKMVEEAREAKLNFVKRLEETQSGALTAEERLIRMEEMHADLESEIERLTKDMGGLNERRYHAANGLMEQRQKEQRLLIELDGNRTLAERLDKKQEQHEAAVFRMTDREVTLDFHIQQMEGRIVRMTNRHVVAEDDSRTRKIAALKYQMEELENQIRTYNKTSYHQQTEMKLLRGELETLTNQESALRNQLEHLDFYTENAMRLLEKTRAEKQKLVYHVCYQKMRTAAVRRREEEARRKKDEKVDRKLQMDAVDQEMKAMVQIITEQSRAELIRVRQHVSEIRINLAHANMTCEQKQKLFESSLLLVPETSQSELVVVIAREKHELRVRGDALDADIRRAEKELEGLKNTLKVLELENSALKAHYELGKKPDVSSEERQKLDCLKKKKREAHQRLTYKLNMLKETVEQMEEEQEKLVEVERQVETVRANQMQRNHFIGKSWEEKKLMSEKLQRAKKALLKAKKGVDKDSLEYRDILLRHRKMEIRARVKQMLSALANHEQDLSTAKKYLTQEGFMF